MDLYNRVRFFAKKGIDACCWLALLPSYLQSKKEIKKEKIQKILVINLQGIGDIVETTPLLTALRNEFKKAQINYLYYKENGAILENDPRINKVIKRQKNGVINQDFLQTLKQIRKEKYDLIINLFPAQHSAILTVFSNAPYKIGNLYSTASTTNNLKVKNATKTWDIRENGKNIAEQLQIKINEPYQPTIAIIKDAEKRIKKEVGNRKYIVINHEAQWKAKQWPEENWKELIKLLLKNKQYHIKIIGTKKEVVEQMLLQFKKEKRVENCAGKYTIQELATVLKYAKLLITTDSGPMHLALATKTKTISLFGCTDPEILVKGNKSIEVLSSYGSCPKKRRFDHNNEPYDPHQEQMRKIEVEDVMNMIKKNL